MIRLREISFAVYTASATLAAFAVLAWPAAADPQVLWETGGFKNPESVVRDSQGQFLYVSNINGEMLEKDGNGYISRITPEGKVAELTWVTGLNAPKGMAIIGTTLFVADIDELVLVDMERRAITERFPAKDAKFLNDVAAGPDGRVFVSDSGTNTIWVYENGTFQPWLSDPKLNAPNGLLVQGEKLIVAAIGTMPAEGKEGTPGHLISVDLASKDIKVLGDGSTVGYLDGVEPLEDGGYLVTDFISGELKSVTVSGKSETLTTFEKGAADHAYDPALGLAVVPLTSGNKVVGFQVE